MKPSLETYTVAMPWYEKEDFARLWALAHDRDEMPAAYEDWHRNATRVLQMSLASGRAIQVITVKPEPFLDWLGDRPNTAAERKRYVELLASNAFAGNTEECV